MYILILDKASLHVYLTTSFRKEFTAAVRTIEALILVLILVSLFHKQAKLLVEVFQLEFGKVYLRRLWNLDRNLLAYAVLRTADE